MTAGGPNKGTRVTSTRAGRLLKAARRHRRAGVFRKLLGYRAAPLFRTGTLATASYGMEVSGCDESVLGRLRTMCVQSWTSTRSSRTAWLLLEGDPTTDLSVACALRWECWESDFSRRALSRSVLEGLYNRISSLSPPHSWRQVRGPLSAAKLELRRLGWSWPSAFAFCAPWGRWWG